MMITTSKPRMIRSTKKKGDVQKMAWDMLSQDERDAREKLNSRQMKFHPCAKVTSY